MSTRWTEGLEGDVQQNKVKLKIR